MQPNEYFITLQKMMGITHWEYRDKAELTQQSKDLRSDGELLIDGFIPLSNDSESISEILSGIKADTILCVFSVGSHNFDKEFIDYWSRFKTGLLIMGFKHLEGLTFEQNNNDLDELLTSNNISTTNIWFFLDLHELPSSCNIFTTTTTGNYKITYLPELMKIKNQAEIKRKAFQFLKSLPTSW